MAGAGCLNCGVRLTGPYCSACGQKAQVPRSLRNFLTDLAASLLNFDGKFWRTLPMLAWCPGELTRRYVEGQRVCFISPVGLYLFSVFLMFAVLGLTGGMPQMDSTTDVYGEAIRDEQDTLRKLQEQRRQNQQLGRSVARVDLEISETRSDIDALEGLRKGEVRPNIDGLETSPPWLRSAIVKAASNPQQAMTKVQEAASTFSWLLIPLSVPALRLLFPLRRRLLYDHTVFVTYSLAFMMLLVIAGGLLALVGGGALIPWLALVPPWHMYRQLRGAYQLSRWGALLRTILLLTAATLILVLWVAIVVAVGSLS
jgi:hypothetical protein